MGCGILCEERGGGEHDSSRAVKNLVKKNWCKNQLRSTSQEGGEGGDG